jgi:hypothetical protein
MSKKFTYLETNQFNFNFFHRIQTTKTRNVFLKSASILVVCLLLIGTIYVNDTKNTKNFEILKIAGSRAEFLDFDFEI